MLHVVINIALTWILSSMLATGAWILLVYFTPKRPRKLRSRESAEGLNGSGRQLTLPY